MQKTKMILLFGVAMSSLFTSCKDPELDALMDEYCTCLQNNKFDPDGRYECIELMEFINEKYKNQPRKLNKVVDKTSDCF